MYKKTGLFLSEITIKSGKKLLDILSMHDIIRLHLQKWKTGSEVLPSDSDERSNLPFSMLLQHHIFIIVRG